MKKERNWERPRKKKNEILGGPWQGPSQGDGRSLEKGGRKEQAVEEKKHKKKKNHGRREMFGKDQRTQTQGRPQSATSGKKNGKGRHKGKGLKTVGGKRKINVVCGKTTKLFIKRVLGCFFFFQPLSFFSFSIFLLFSLFPLFSYVSHKILFSTVSETKKQHHNQEEWIQGDTKIGPVLEVTTN